MIFKKNLSWICVTLRIFKPKCLFCQKYLARTISPRGIGKVHTKMYLRVGGKSNKRKKITKSYELKHQDILKLTLPKCITQLG